MNKELLEAMEILEKEKNISKDTMIEAIENSLITACKNHFGKADNVRVAMNRTTGDFAVYAEKEVVEEVEDSIMEISLADARMISPKYVIGDTVQVPLDSKKFGRIATQNAKNVILQKIREEERKALYNDYYSMEKDVATGIVQRYLGRNISINLGKVDAILNESEQVKGETFHLLVYLLSQFPCRGHYYTVDGIFGMPAFRKLVQYGQQVRGGFSGSGLCNSYQIPAFEYNWY